MRRWWYLGPAVIISMFFMIMMVIGEPGFRAREMAVFFVWIIHVAVIIRSITAGMNSIGREHVGLTWDSLVMTGISARQILLGKWRAALRRVAPWFFAFGLVRLLMLPVFLYSVLTFFSADYASCLNYYTSGSANSMYSNPPAMYCDELGEIGWVPWAAVVAAGASIGLSLLEVLACTLLGIACSAVARSGILAAIMAFCIRFAPIAIFTAITYHDTELDKKLFTPNGVYTYSQNLSYEVLRYAPFALADGGTAPISRLMVPLIPWSYDPLRSFSTHVDALLGLSYAIALIVMLLVGSYFMAWMAIRSTGALPEAKAM